MDLASPGYHHTKLKTAFALAAKLKRMLIIRLSSLILASVLLFAGLATARGGSMRYGRRSLDPRYLSRVAARATERDAALYARMALSKRDQDGDATPKPPTSRPPKLTIKIPPPLKYHEWNSPVTTPEEITPKASESQADKQSHAS
ncbi:hypothetical protein F5887DRAFT_1290302 [Amanita rubescens]|nr:hypothetical protein F5887DRAFT_1290302 [Amanita rubescens]